MEDGKVRLAGWKMVRVRLAGWKMVRVRLAGWRGGREIVK